MVIFVLGNSRSGTTMMGRILNMHPDIYTFQELHYFDELVSPFSTDKSFTADKAESIFASLLAAEYSGYFRRSNPGREVTEEARNVLHKQKSRNVFEIYELFLKYVTTKNNKRHPCEQTPQNLFFASEILDNVSEAKVIVMVRDPRDVLLSQKHKWRRRKLTEDHYPWIESFRARINYHPVTISRIWASSMKEVAKFKDDTRVLTIRYEDLVGDPVNTVSEVCSHLNISYEKDMVNVPKKGSSNKADSKESKGIDASRSGRWRKHLSGTEAYICQSIIGSRMLHYDYHPEVVNVNYLKLAYYFLTLPFSLAIALLFNLKRARDPVKLLKKLFN